LDDVCWVESEIEKLEAMYNYFCDAKSDCMDYLFDIDEFVPELRLQKIFDQISLIVVKIEAKEDYNKFWYKLDKLFKSIKEKLDSEQIKDKMTVLEYNRWVSKYNEAIYYIREIYV